MHFVYQFFPLWIPQNTDVDIMMLLDSSSSVGLANFKHGKRGIKVRSFYIVIRKVQGLSR